MTLVLIAVIVSLMFSLAATPLWAKWLRARGYAQSIRDADELGRRHQDRGHAHQRRHGARAVVPHAHYRADEGRAGMFSLHFQADDGKGVGDEEEYAGGNRQRQRALIGVDRPAPVDPRAASRAARLAASRQMRLAVQQIAFEAGDKCV